MLYCAPFMHIKTVPNGYIYCILDKGRVMCTYITNRIFSFSEIDYMKHNYIRYISVTNNQVSLDSPDNSPEGIVVMLFGEAIGKTNNDNKIYN